jgi:ABC-type multidrug transport system ATPase subunit
MDGVAMTSVDTERLALCDRHSEVAAVNLRDVHKSFGTVEAVRGIDLTVGEVMAFLGRNGAGKTSTIDTSSKKPNTEREVAYLSLKRGAYRRTSGHGVR